MNSIYTLQRARRERVTPYLNFDLKRATQRMEWQFAFFSANLHNLLPELPRREYVHTFKRLQANLALSFMDIEHATFPGFIRVHGWNHDWATALSGQPGIICTFHTGAYRYISYLLMQACVPISIVMAGRAMPREKDLFDGLAARMAESNHSPRPDVEFIDTGHPHALFRMAKAATYGRSLLVYIDGNTGVEGNARDNTSRNLLAVPFCGWQMNVRQGMAALAHRLKLPIYPIICERKTGVDMHLGHHFFYRHFNPICPLPGEAQAAFAARATICLYGLLEQFVTRNPDQWEGWLSLHHHLVLTPTTDLHEVEDPTRWAPYRRGKRALLLHRPTYASYEVHWKVFHEKYPWYNADFLEG